MTTSQTLARVGAQPPRVSSVPKYATSAGIEAAELAASAGLVLDPWQVDVLKGSLGERRDGQWSAFEVAVIVGRQNGKGAILEARELAGLFLFGEQLILHSAHEFKTAQEAFRRVLQLIEGTTDLMRLVKKVRNSHGEEGVELKNGARLRFVARSSGSGRGFSGDCVILDEAYNLSSEGMAALLPTLSARPNPQLWYMSSAGMETSHQLRSLRDRGREGNDPALAYFEYSAHPKAAIDDRDAWVQANPAMGIRITEEFVQREMNAMPADVFARERLGVWQEDGGRSYVIDMNIWNALADESLLPGDPLTFAIDVSPSQEFASIAVAGSGIDGRTAIEIAENGTGMGWVVDRTAGMLERWSGSGVTLDPSGPAGALLPDFARRGIEVNTTTARDMVQACGNFYSACINGTLVHRGQLELSNALAGARKRDLGDAWAWRRKDSAVDISPLVAATLAHWKHSSTPEPGEPGLYVI